MSEKRLFCIRGACCAENTKESILENTNILFDEIVRNNALEEGEFVSIQFTITPDLDQMNPAAALRHGQNKDIASRVPLFCSQEPVIKGMLAKAVRIMVTVYKDTDFKPKASYINGAQILRPDLAE